ncbi:MAG TPA: glycosyltransferase [Rhizomicrobium sp.]|nr:glycosyltransferase [Rhizomicrobium sp.]
MILSPTASHPQDYGNRHRVYQTTSFLKEQGYEIHFLLYPGEPDWRKAIPASARTMRDAWESFALVPASGVIQPAAIGEHHCIDEWWSPWTEAYLKWLFKREFFEVFVVNYAFLSRAFLLAPAGTAKVLETHDRFAGRKELLTALGAPLEAFYTTEDQEAIALARSDVVVAIKDSEARHYQALAPDRTVLSVPFWPGRKEERHATRPAEAGDALRAGFIGALNVVNVAVMTRFAEAFGQYRASSMAPMTLTVAGEVCAQLRSDIPGVHLLGRVAKLEEFYDNVDVIVTPMMFSTGLKIKVAEALGFGKAIVSTENGFDGFSPTDPFHTLGSIDEICEALVVLSTDRERLNILQCRTDEAAALACERCRIGYDKLADAIRRHSGTTVFLTDYVLDECDDVGAERIAQWCELVSQVTSTVVIYLGSRPFGRLRPELECVDVFRLPEDGEFVRGVEAALRELERSHSIVEIVLSIGGAAGLMLWHALKPIYKRLTLDTWRPELARIASQSSPPPASDIWLAPDGIVVKGGGRHLPVTPFRNLPSALRPWKSGNASGLIVVRCAPEWFDQLGVEAICSRATPACPASPVDLVPSGGSDFDPGFIESLAALGKPRMFIAVGSDPRARAVCQSVAALVHVPCLELDGSRFPHTIKLNDGTLRLCWTYEDVAQRLADLEELSRGASRHHPCSGWLTYSRLLADRTEHENRLPGPGGPPGTKPALRRGTPYTLARLTG